MKHFHMITHDSSNNKVGHIVMSSSRDNFSFSLGAGKSPGIAAGLPSSFGKIDVVPFALRREHPFRRENALRATEASFA